MIENECSFIKQRIFMPFECGCQCLFTAGFKTAPCPAEISPEPAAGMIPRWIS